MSESPRRDVDVPWPDHLTAKPFMALPVERADDVARETFGLTTSPPAVRLATERDDTFRVRSESGDFILKIAHPDDDPATINLQTEALEYAASMRPSLPLQRVQVALDGTKEPRIVGEDGRLRVARLLSFLPGKPLREVTPQRLELQACGRMQAELAEALVDFDHPAADRHLLYDLQNVGELRGLISLVDSDAVARAFAWYDEVFPNLAARLPRQVLHTDFGLDNILVSPGSRAYVTGILDWGDVVRTWRAGDLASGLASQIATTGPAWARAAEMVRGYETVTPLTPEETEVLPGLVAMRLAQRILLAIWLSTSRPANATYLRRNLTASHTQLANLDYF